MNAPQCPSCKQSNTRRLEGQRAICQSCSITTRRVFQFCCTCQREWQKSALTYSCVHCAHRAALRSALLSDKQIDNPNSSARGCPYFRACPRCKALLTHSGQGCPKITCANCRTRFCFRCLNQQCSGFSLDFSNFQLHHRLFLFEDYDLQPCRVVDNRQSLADLGL